MRLVSIVAAALMLSFYALGCTCSTGACPEGTVNCPCGSGASCGTGLTCVGGRCFDPAHPWDAGPGALDGRTDARRNPIPSNTDWAEDPPPSICYPDGGMGPVPDPPGGTSECPDDRNREGCRCLTVGETAPCWPGHRVDRNRGICHDGMTTCEEYDEFTGAWGPCLGYILPVEGATYGPEACDCFSAGRWDLDNTSPCTITDGEGNVQYMVSTNPDTSQCPEVSQLPPGIPSTPFWSIWSRNRLNVDCEGLFNLCYTLRAGDVDNPQATDCVITKVCTGDFWYETRDVVQEMPPNPLPGWVSTNVACIEQFQNTGGYGEMTVLGKSLECDPIDDGAGHERVFQRTGYCASDCAHYGCATTPDCPSGQSCVSGVCRRAACTSDAECPEPEACDDNECVPDYCVGCDSGGSGNF